MVRKVISLALTQVRRSIIMVRKIAVVTAKAHKTTTILLHRRLRVILDQTRT